MYWLVAWLIVVLCAPLASSLASGSAPIHVHLSVGATPSEMNVVWYTESDAGTAVEFGTKSEHYSAQITNPDGKRTLTYGTGYMHHVVMKDLLEDTKYYYRVGDASANKWSKEFNFHTMQLSDEVSDEVTFTALGDMGVFDKAAKMVDELAPQAKDHDIDFALHVGDLAYAFGNWTKWDTWFTRIENVAAYVPYLVCAGNRDEAEIIQERFYMPNDIAKDHDANPSTPPQLNSKSREKQNFYYSFDYDFVHVVALSIKDEFEPGSEQYKWLEKDLATTKMRMEADIIKWSIVIGHTPFYSSSNGHTGGNKALKTAIEGLVYKYNVTFGIWGDDHNYERSYPLYDDVPDIPPQSDSEISKFINPKKPIHLLIGTGGIGLDGWSSPDPPAWSAYREISHGYLKFKCNRSMCKAQFISLSDEGNTEVKDEFWVVKHPGFLSGSQFYIWLLPVAALFILLIKKNIVSLPARTKRFL